MRVGITGHQRLDDSSAWSWVEAEVTRELNALPPPLVAVTSLAIGADQLLARMVLARRGNVHAVLPFEGLERSFSAEDLPAFEELKRQASLETLATPGDDEDAYLAAGKRVADLSDLLIAVWNGKPAKGKGGTADIVAYANERHIPLVHVNPVERRVRHFNDRKGPTP